MLRVREALGAYVANLIVVRLRWGLGVREGSRFIVLRFRISHRHLEHMLETMTLSGSQRIELLLRKTKQRDSLVERIWGT